MFCERTASWVRSRALPEWAAFEFWPVWKERVIFGAAGAEASCGDRSRTPAPDGSAGTVFAVECSGVEFSGSCMLGGESCRTPACGDRFRPAMPNGDSKLTSERAFEPPPGTGTDKTASLGISSGAEDWIDRPSFWNARSSIDSPIGWATAGAAFKGVVRAADGFLPVSGAAGRGCDPPLTGGMDENVCSASMPGANVPPATWERTESDLAGHGWVGTASPGTAHADNSTGAMACMPASSIAAGMAALPKPLFSAVSLTSPLSFFSPAVVIATCADRLGSGSSAAGTGIRRRGPEKSRCARGLSVRFDSGEFCSGLRSCPEFAEGREEAVPRGAQHSTDIPGASPSDTSRLVQRERNSRLAALDASLTAAPDDPRRMALSPDAAAATSGPFPAPFTPAPA